MSNFWYCVQTPKKEPYAILISLVLFPILSINAAGCHSHETDQEDPIWTDTDVEIIVEMEQRQIYSPAPNTNGSPPERCNYVKYLRFGLKGGNTENADAVVVMIPGILAGSNTFHYMAKQMVYMAKKQRDTRLEILVSERRTNNVEDLIGINAAEEDMDVQTAIDYYYNGAEINGNKFEGFLTDEDVPFLSEFGLDLVVRDVYTIISTEVPDQLDRQQKVFVGGHSLGGPLSAFFAGWDFDGDPETKEDAGYMNVAGLFGLDTVISSNAIMSLITGSGLLDLMNVDEVTNMSYPLLVKGIREGSLNRVFPLSSIGFCDETFMMIELAAMLADWYPDEESTVLRDFEQTYSSNIEAGLKFVHSKNLVDPQVA